MFLLRFVPSKNDDDGFRRKENNIACFHFQPAWLIILLLWFWLPNGVTDSSLNECLTLEILIPTVHLSQMYFVDKPTVDYGNSHEKQGTVPHLFLTLNYVFFSRTIFLCIIIIVTFMAKSNQHRSGMHNLGCIHTSGFPRTQAPKLWALNFSIVNQSIGLIAHLKNSKSFI